MLALRTGVAEYGICVRTATIPPESSWVARQRESSKNRAHEQLSKQTADRCEGARLLMTEEKNEREQYRELNMMKHASSSSLQSTKKKTFL